jgi:hypothetical protein
MALKEKAEGWAEGKEWGEVEKEWGEVEEDDYKIKNLA